MRIVNKLTESSRESGPGLDSSLTVLIPAFLCYLGGGLELKTLCSGGMAMQLIPRIMVLRACWERGDKLSTEIEVAFSWLLSVGTLLQRPTCVCCVL